ncbi:MAG: ribonuclease D [Alphaproteobacteria bacterium]|nr:ribonuclease D [Alphaproteobacteria bacterium]
MTIFLHRGDLPKDVTFNGDIGVDCEAMGLNNHRDRLCVVQLSDGNGDAHLVQFMPGEFNAPNLCALLTDPKRVKIFHFGRFDIALIKHYLGVVTAPVYCTKIASRLCRTYTDRHGFKDLCRELLTTEVSKQQQSSDWGAEVLTPEQQEYAASDVLHLHKLREKLNVMLEREGRTKLAQECFAFLPSRALLDLEGWAEQDIFSHGSN